MLRVLAVLALLSAAACTNPDDLDQEPVYLGNFQLGHAVVVAPKLTRGPASRKATDAEWIAAMTDTLTDRFSRYRGGKLHHLGVSLEGYVLALPGVPVVASPKSALILNVTVWDDAAGEKLNPEPHMVTVVESISPSTWIGSGLTQSREEQLENLTLNAAKQIETWMTRQNATRGWFEPRAVSANETPQPDRPGPRPPARPDPADGVAEAATGATQ
jgi:hypothetical protein